MDSEEDKKESTLQKRPREDKEDEEEEEEKGSTAVKKSRSTIPKNFPSPHGYTEFPLHYWERIFYELSREIRSKPNWFTKVNDETILEKWKKEISEKEDDGLSYSFMWERLKAELQFLASLVTDEAEPTSVDGVWMKDDVIPSKVHDKFVGLVKNELESKEKEYHPYSNDTVVDLVHPALYCYVHGQTKLLEERDHSQLHSLEEWKKFVQSGTSSENKDLSISLNTIAAAKKMENEDSEGSLDCGDMDPSLLFHQHVPDDPYNYEDNETELNEAKEDLANRLAGIYRWLPSDISVNMYGNVVFNSYINGLHPFEHKELYSSIAEIMNYFIPLWSNVLADLSDSFSYTENRLNIKGKEYDLDEGIGFYSLSSWLEEEPDRELLNPFEVEKCTRIPVDLTRSSLKVIVKIASIELTPEKPTYKGTWHLEGVPEEHILSTGIYYFGEENIEENHLEFRLAQSDPPGNVDIQCPMGLGSGVIMNRDAGKVVTKQGRIIAFPNIMQHCVKGVTLKDKTKPGFRKILVFFLVDPNHNHEVVSTGNVPPPCKEWVEKVNPGVTDNSLQTLEDARFNRENLMFTRKYYVVSQNETLFERECTFCEH